MPRPRVWAITAAVLGAFGLSQASVAAATYPPAYPTTVVPGQWATLVAPNSTAPNLYGVACPTATICYAVGQGGTVEAGNASSVWRTGHSGTALDLFAIACPRSTVCLAVGGITGSGVIVATTTALRAWHVVYTTPHELHGLSCANTSVCVAVGDNGVIVRTGNAGSTWRARQSNVLQALYGVSCPAATERCLAVGSLGHFASSADLGLTWTAGWNGIAKDADTITCPSSAGCIVGSGAGIWTAAPDGTSWVQEHNSAGYQPACINATTCGFASGGGVLTTTNDGQTWVTQLVGGQIWLSGFACRAANNCYAVGELGVVVHSVNAFATPSPPAINITSYTPPTSGSFAQAIVTGPDGAMWATEFHGNAILRIATSGAEQEFPLPIAGSEPEAITSGPDGALWFTESGTERIGRITTTGALTEYQLSGACSSCNLPDIITGPDGALWFSELQGDKIGRITTAGTVTEHTLPPSMMPEHLVSGSDGNVWFAGYSDTLNKMTPAGALTTYSVPELGGFGGLIGITNGPDGNFWFTATVASWVGVATTSGTVLAQYSVHPGIEQISTITTGPDGNLWFADTGTLDRITLSGVLTEYPAPGESWVTLGPGGTSIWFASFSLSQVGVVTSAAW